MSSKYPSCLPQSFVALGRLRLGTLWQRRGAYAKFSMPIQAPRHKFQLQSIHLAHNLRSSDISGVAKMDSTMQRAVTVSHWDRVVDVAGMNVTILS